MLASKIFPIGIGTDICRVSRIYKNLTSKSGVKFINRILTPEELRTPRATGILGCVHMQQKDAVVSKSPQPSGTRSAPRDPDMMKAAEFMAGRFAAKEAVMKAYSLRQIFFQDIIITYEHLLSQKPKSEESSSSQEEESSNLISETNWPRKSPPVALIKNNGTYEDVHARLSISHDGDYAVAFCLAFLKDPVPSES
ncbi:hypothetical protein F5Y13DRAFT_166946 [Hypoxylon sp. FL1857]|nr:hypothetical protein F5Y13DRAFT_166946 [Hypoxylon sp. FL1857]